MTPKSARDSHNPFVAESALWHQPPPPRRGLVRGTVSAVRNFLYPWVPPSVRKRLRRFVPGARGNMGSLEFRLNLYHLAVQVLEFGVPGDFAEIGCNAGQSSVVLQKILQDLDPSRKLYVYDSFQGVPKSDNTKDEGAYNEGDMTASQEELRENFRLMGLPQPEVHPGWFENTLAPTLPPKLAFCLIDADLFSSTTTALTEAYQRLSPGGICVLGVYCDTQVFEPRSTSPKYRSPGVKKACDEFLAGKPERMSVLFSGDYTSGYFRKR